MYTSTNTAPTLVTNGNSVSVASPQQRTPDDISKYLTEMGFNRSYLDANELWSRPNISGYFTWEQAVAYCLVKPWLNP